MLNASEEKRVHAGSIVKGIVTSISANEIQVDIGAKQTGFVKLSELDVYKRQPPSWAA